MKGYWQRPEATAERDRRRRLVPHRRHRARRRGRLLLHRRPQEGRRSSAAATTSTRARSRRSSTSTRRSARPPSSASRTTTLGEEVGAAVALKAGATIDAAASCATSSRSASPPTSTRGTCGSSTSCPRARPARSSSARSRSRRGEVLLRHRHDELRGAPRSTSCSPTPRSGGGRASCGRGAPRSVAAGLARHPVASARRVGGLGARAGPRGRRALRPQARASATGASPIRRGSRAGCSGGCCRPTSRSATTVDGLISDARRSTGARERQARFAAGNVLDALAPTQLPVVEPDGAQGDRRPGRRATSCAARATSPSDFPRPAGDGRHEQVRGRREPRASRRARSCCAPRSSSSSSTRRRPSRSARCRCCSRRRRSTSTTSSTSRPAAAWSSGSSSQGQQVFVDLLAQPGRRAGPLRPRHLRRARCSRRATPSPTITGQPAVHLNGACSGGIIGAGAARPPRRRGPARRGREPDPAGRARSTTSAPGRRRRSPSREIAAAAVAESARRGYLDGQALAGVFTWLRPERPGLELRRQQLPARQAAAGVRRPLLEPGHRPPRRRPAPRLHPHRRSRTRSREPGALEVLGTPVDLGAVDVDSYVVAGLDRPHHPVGERLPQHAAARRRRRASCSPPAATSRRSSTRPRPDSRAELPRRRRAPGRRRGVGRAGRRRGPGAGGPTTTSGSPRAPASSSPRRQAPRQRAATRRTPRRRAPTSTRAERSA